QGVVSEDGQFSVSVDLASAETGIPIRNERLAQFLFETTKFSQASAKGKIDLAALGKQTIGSSQTVKLPVIFELHGKTITQDASLTLTKLSASQVAVVTSAPIFLNAADFDLLPGIEKLKELAALPSISPLVPISLHLRFTHEASKKG
ncbi:MAG TPA: YceI family protein, partial [Cellvibrionaceae bacterium]|nr:YceI family protein [Cellvibrionaceae bacterium]